MFYSRKRFPAWAKWAVVAALVLLSVFSGIVRYQIYRDRTAPPVPLPVPFPEPPAEHVPVPLPVKPEEPLPPSVLEKVKSGQLWLHVVKGTCRLYLYRGQNLERTFEVAVGANGGQKKKVGDSRTPTGSFTVQQIQNSTSWTYDFGDGKGPIPRAYGPWFIRLKTPGWTGIGIHGTHDPTSIGNTITQGCIRMRNPELEELKKLVFVGMKVIISE